MEEKLNKNLVEKIAILMEGIACVKKRCDVMMKTAIFKERMRKKSGRSTKTNPPEKGRKDETEKILEEERGTAVGRNENFEVVKKWLEACENV